jgi:two-component system NarL family sensor kinase
MDEGYAWLRPLSWIALFLLLAPGHDLLAAQTHTTLLIHQASMAHQAAGVVLLTLRSGQVTKIPMQANRAVAMVAGRQLQPWHIIGIIALCFVEALLIFALVFLQARRKRAEKYSPKSPEFLQSTIDALDAHIAILDEKANIIAVNESWRRFATSHGYTGAEFGVGTNYLEVCKSSSQCEEARLVYESLCAMMTGQSSGFYRVYECSHGTNESWFQLRASRFFNNGLLRLTLAHENITEIKRAHDRQQRLTGLLLHAQDEERRRIARDLHEVTVQNIATIRVGLANAVRTSKSVWTHVLRESELLCDQVIQELRSLSYLLHPPLLDEVGLVAALQCYVRGFAQRSGIDVEILVVENIGRLPSDAETALFRIVQESLTNIHRHSGSRCAVVWVTKDGDDVVVRIQDEGHGMPQRPADRYQKGRMPGVGILGMRQRLRQLGGRLEIESDSQGTTVTARAPISKESYVANSCSR